jgi:hypothetical protein
MLLVSHVIGYNFGHVICLLLFSRPTIAYQQKEHTGTVSFVITLALGLEVAALATKTKLLLTNTVSFGI